MYLVPLAHQPIATLTNSSLWGPVASIAAAAIAAAVAIVVFALRAAAAAQDRKREMCARALADALAWLELPYRIRRRKDDSPETLALLAGHAHSLQEKLLFHSAWLCIELPSTAPLYHTLLQSVRAIAQEPLKEAWCSPAIAHPEQMNLGSLVPPPPADQITAFCQAVRRDLTLLHWCKGP
jgi:hypothetical protein